MWHSGANTRTDLQSWNIRLAHSVWNLHYSTVIHSFSVLICMPSLVVPGDPNRWGQLCHNTRLASSVWNYAIQQSFIFCVDMYALCLVPGNPNRWWQLCHNTRLASCV